MKKYQIYIYGRIKDFCYCRMIFRIDYNDQKQFLIAETKKNKLSAQMEMSYDEATSFVKENKLRLIDKFTTSI